MPSKADGIAEWLVEFLVPIRGGWKALYVAIHEQEVGSRTMDVGVGISFAGHGSQASVVIHPNQRGWLRDRAEGALSILAS